MQNGSLRPGHRKVLGAALLLGLFTIALAPSQAALPEENAVLTAAPQVPSPARAVVPPRHLPHLDTLRSFHLRL